MEITNNFSSSLHTVIRELIEKKSQRDDNPFTASQLAAALGMPRSMITKLTHVDKSKRVTNPRIDTLLKIVDFFKADGFSITIEELLGMESKTIEINNDNIVNASTFTIPIHALDDKNKKLGTIDINLNTSTQSKNIFALRANRDIKPFFKIGSIFIIDKDMPPENDTLIAIKLDTSKEVHIKKYLLEKNKIILKSFDNDEKDIVLMPTTQCEIIGVVIQVNAKT